MKDIDTQRRELIEKEEHFEAFYAREVLGHRSNYNPHMQDVSEEDASLTIYNEEEEDGIDSGSD